MRYATSVLFGGAGFIGVHLARHLIAHDLADHVYLCDLASPQAGRFPPSFEREQERGRIRFVVTDVRHPIEVGALPRQADLVVNLAAVHREPGHEPREYFETNIRGAEHVCDWASRAGTRELIFTSSIAPYGEADEPVDESSLPVPLTPYGASKLTAEKMHIGWQREAPTNRRLLIVRCGVVFGAGEQGNVTRMIQAVLRGYFVYVGNRRTRKAGGYIKELCHSIVWGLDRLSGDGAGVELFNFTMDPAPTVEDYVAAIRRVAEIRRFVPGLPMGLVYPASAVVHGAARLAGIESPFHPRRIRKAAKSNDIVPQHLRDHGYRYRFTLEQALADWREECGRDWLKSS